MTPTILIIHHNDWDGIAAAWAIVQSLGEDEPYELVPAKYGDEPPDVTGRVAWVVDFSYPREFLLAMNSAAKSLRVLDHHKSATEALSGLDFCEFDMSRSGAMMAWEAAMPKEPLPPEPPQFIRYVQDRDLWHFELPDSREINSFIFSYPMTLESCDELALEIDDNYDGAVMAGAAIENFRDRLIERAVGNHSFLELESHRFVVLNCAQNTSEVAQKLIEDHNLPSALWRRRGDGKAHWELRSRDHLPDVSAVAVALGGGGHRNASGFVVDWATHNRLLGEE